MSMVGTTRVAKKRRDEGEAVGSSPEKWSRKAIIFTLRGSEEYKAWLDGLAQADATDLSELAERAFAAYARQIGYANPRPKR
jgi:hypothetical protein